MVIDNLSGGRLKNLKHHKNNKRLIFKKIDINKISKNKKIFNNISYVFHFAGIGDIVPSIENPSNYMTTNVQGTVNVLEAARYSKVKKFIYAASSSCYGINNHRIKENTKINPQHPYALSKYLGEEAALHWNKVYGLPVNSIRIFNAYGPRVRTTGVYGAVFGVFFKQKLKNKPLTVIGNGKQSRDFVYVTDVVKANLIAAQSDMNGEVINIGTGNPKSVNHLAKLISKDIIHIPKRPGEPNSTHADITKVKKLLKWKPEVSFEDGVKIMLENINYWKDAPLWDPDSIEKETKSWFKYLKT